MGMNGSNTANAPQSELYEHQPSQQSSQQPAFGGFGFNSGALSAGATDISGVASSFAFNKANENEASPPPVVSPSGALNAQNTATTTGSTFSVSPFSSPLSYQPTGTTNTSNATGSLKPQLTGFAGLKPFKPSSSFGASLLESLPPIPGSSPGTPVLNGNANGTTSSSSGGFTSPGTHVSGMRSTSQPLGAGGFGNSGSTLGQGLRPQMTGGAANPFRASMMGLPAGGAPYFDGNPSFTPFTPNSASMTPSFAANTSGRAFGSGFTSTQSQQQKNAAATLI